MTRVSTRILTASVALAASVFACAAYAMQNHPSTAVLFAVSPAGNDSADGSPEHPFRTLERAQAAVRQTNRLHDVTVQLEDGTYRLNKTLIFRAADGGQGVHRVVWQAAPGARPVIAGAVPISGWKLFDATRKIYVADTPVGLDARDLWVNGRMARLASIEVPRSAVKFTRVGVTIEDAKYAYITHLSDVGRIDVIATGFFTRRIAPVERASGQTLIMKQPSWDNNLWGYDTIERPFHPELAHLYFANSLAFLNKPGQWYLDPVRGKLYLRPPLGVDPKTMDVDLPQLTALVAIAGTLARPVQDLTFEGIQFSYTTWLGPLSAQGYADQQSGTFLAGFSTGYPADPIKSCSQGCPAFESRRSEWSQMPASIQVSAAERIVFRHDLFVHLGQYALGIGNDADATETGVGLGTGDVQVIANVFADEAGGAIMAGGVRPEAHHPRDPRETNQALVVRSNRIEDVSEQYSDNSAILSTYITGAAILHNDISNVPYDAIDIGFGWGINDPGGNQNYRFRMRGYQWPQNRIYTTPTTHRDVIVASNLIDHAKQFFHDGGAIYNLSASRGTLITENYILDNSGRIGLYLDEGSRYITIRKNVVNDAESEWLNINTVHSAFPLRISPDNTAVDNWHNSQKIGGMWTNYQNDLIVDDHLIRDGNWPADAQAVMKQAGIESSLSPPAYNGEGAWPAGN